MKIESNKDFELKNVSLLTLGNELKKVHSTYTALLQFKKTIEIEGSPVEFTLLDSTMLFNSMMMKHYEKDFIFNLDTTKPTIYPDLITIREILTNYFLEYWKDYRNKNLYSWGRMLEAWVLEYNPIENYDRYEDILQTYEGGERETVEKDGLERNITKFKGQEEENTLKKGSEKNTLTKSGSEKDTLTKSGTEETLLEKGTTHETSLEEVSPFEEVGNGFSNNKKVTNDTSTVNDINTLTFDNRTDENTTTFTNRKDENELTFTNREDSSIKSFNNRENENTLTYEDRTDTRETMYRDREDKTKSHIHGNIGVTTSTAMVSELLEQRLHSLADKILDDFINMYCTIIPRV